MNPAPRWGSSSLTNIERRAHTLLPTIILTISLSRPVSTLSGYVTVSILLTMSLLFPLSVRAMVD